MNFTTFSLGIVVLCAVFSISCGQVTQCVHCEGKDACGRRNLPTVNCTQVDVTRTLNYLDLHYQNVNRTVSTVFQCLRHTFTIPNSEFHYRGCVNNVVQGCQLTVRPFHAGQFTQQCHQCYDRNNCNPADRAHTNALGVAAAVVLAVVGKYFV